MNQSKLFNTPKGEADDHAYHSPLEQKVEKILSPFQAYIDSQALSGALLLIATLIAVVWANSWFSAGYYHFIHTPVGFVFGEYSFQKSLQFWTNDVLLTLFFFSVGLEIKREFLVGELANVKTALFIVFAAVGGMLVPAIIYSLFNYHQPTQHGWGIPIATDTAFAVGILSFFRHKIDKSIFTLLAALAIIDDIGAIVVIAVFYTKSLHIMPIVYALMIALAMCMMNYAGHRRPLMYIVLGVCIWYNLETAHIHGSVAGVLTSFLIPARPKKGPRKFILDIRERLSIFEKRKQQTPLVLKDDIQHEVIEEVQDIAKQATTPLQRWHSLLTIPTAMIILPIFALFNAGTHIDWPLIQSVFTHPLSLGIMLGLFIGKPLGVLLFSTLGTKLKIIRLPEKTNFHDLFYVAWLTGIGFTMSLFIAQLSFHGQDQYLVLAKGAILLSSVLSIIVSLLCLVSRRQLSSQD